MLIRNYSTSTAYFRRLFPFLLRVMLRTFFGVHGRARWAAVRVMARRAAVWPAMAWRQWRQGVKNPVTLSIVDDIACRAACANCVFTAFKVRGPGLSLDDLDRLFGQALEMNVTNVYLMGADPFYRANIDAFLDVLAARKWQFFYLFTEGQRVTDAHLDRIRRAGNIVPVMNIDGLREATERRKGAGSFDAVEALLGKMRDARMPYFVTTMTSRANHDEVTSPAYVQWLEAMGAFLVAYVPYTPMDVKAEADLVMDDAMRGALFERSIDLNRHVRRMAVLDLLGIEQHLTSCPAAVYTITVYHDGTVTPCPAVTFGRTDSNVRTRHLRDVFLHDDLYVALRQRHRDTPGRLHCQFYTDPSFLARYVATHPDEITVLNPGALKMLERDL